jgi:hypothetical protein
MSRAKEPNLKTKLIDIYRHINDIYHANYDEKVVDE